MQKFTCLVFAILFFSAVFSPASLAYQGEAFADNPALLTSVGQSADIEMVRVLLTRAGMPFRSEALLYADGLDSEDRTLILVVGGSAKGLGAAGISADDELARSQALVNQAREMGMSVIAVHVGGDARRGALSDRFINFAIPVADYVIVVSTGNADGLFTDLTEQAGIQLTSVGRIAEAGAPLIAAFR